MIKYCFVVYDKESKEKVTSVVCDVYHMIETVKALSELGYVKGYIMNEDEVK